MSACLDGEGVGPRSEEIPGNREGERENVALRHINIKNVLGAMTGRGGIGGGRMSYHYRRMF